MFSLESIERFNELLFNLLGSAFLLGLLLFIALVVLTLAFAGVCLVYEFFVEDVLKGIQKKRLRRLKIDAEVIGRVE